MRVRIIESKCLSVTECLMPIVVSVPLQLLAYHIVVKKERGVDRPRDRTKSVTIE